MKYLVLASLLLVSSISSATKTPAEIWHLDFTGFEFGNHCEPADRVTVTSGVIHIVVRADFGGDVDGVHLLSNAAGSFRGLGQETGDEYLVNVTAASSFLPVSGDISISNFVNGSGMANVLFHIEMINLSDPGSGIAQTKIVIVSVTDGTTEPGFGENKVLEVSRECVGQ